MNIGIVTTWFERGAAYVSRQFMDVLQRTDNVFIYARGGERYEKGNPVWDLENVWWAKIDKGMSVIGVTGHIVRRDFEKWIESNKIEAVIFNEQHWFQPVLWCKEMGVKTLSYIDYYTEETIPLFDVYDCLICNTKRHHFAFRNHRNAAYFKWGTNLDVYKPAGNYPEKTTFFNSAGMSPERKGTDLVIKAFHGLNRRKEMKLLIHTQVPLSNHMPELSGIIDEMVAEGSMEIVHKTVPAPGLYCQADIYVYPSRLDGIGLTLMEAEASGLACITVDNPPMNEFIDESFGMLCDVDYFYSRKDGYYWPMCVADVDSLASMMDAISSNRDALRAKQRAARQYAEAEIDFSKNAACLHDIVLSAEFGRCDGKTIEKINKYDNRGIRKYAGILSPVARLKYK